MKQTIFEHTETATAHPGYISIGEESNGMIYATARHRGGNSASTVQLDLDALKALALSISAYIEECESKKKPKVIK